MNLIHTNDGEYYRRWVNVIFSWLMPGSAQFLSGRKKVGVVWFVSCIVCYVSLVGYLVHPKSPYSIISMGPCSWALTTLTFVIAGDALRRPVRRLHSKGWILFLCVWCGIIILLVLAVFAIRTFFVHPFKVPTGAMQPTIMGTRKDSRGNQLIGDHIFVNKLTYRFSQPQRGDVIVFNTKGIRSLQLDTHYIKRLAGLPGETISIDPPYLIVNGSKVTEPDIFRKIAEGQDGFHGFCPAKSNAMFSAFLTSPADKITLSPDEYLVLGDNTTNSLDGRYFGPIKRSAIEAKAFYIYAPADRKRQIE